MMPKRPGAILASPTEFASRYSPAEPRLQSLRAAAGKRHALVEPAARPGVEVVVGDEFPAVEEVAAHVADWSLDLPLRLRAAHPARPDAEALVGAEPQELRFSSSRPPSLRWSPTTTARIWSKSSSEGTPRRTRTPPPGAAPPSPSSVARSLEPQHPGVAQHHHTVANVRVHGTLMQRPVARFEDERCRLLPLAARPYRSVFPVAAPQAAPKSGRPVVTVERRTLTEYARIAEAAS